jgi:DNA cross-link repair 1B protein
VTPFCSGHCPGAVAFLFEGACGRVLHTGDWRLSNLELIPACLLSGGPLDMLWLDNTYCHPSYSHPAQEESLRQLVQLVEQRSTSAVGSSDAPPAWGRLLIGVDALGKEALLEAVAAAAGGLVCVTRERFLGTLTASLPVDHLTCMPDEALVLTCPRWRFCHASRTVRPPHCKSGLAAPVDFAILPTGWPPPPGATTAPPPGAIGYSHVPFSLHASFSELHSLVALLRPRRIVGLTAAPRFAERPTDPMLHFAHLLSAAPGPSRELAIASAAPREEAAPERGAAAAPAALPESRESMLARMRRSAAVAALDERGGAAGRAKKRAAIAPLPALRPAAVKPAEREVWVEAVDRAGVGAGAAAGGGVEVEGVAAVLEAEVVALARRSS